MHDEGMATAENILTWASAKRPGPDYVLTSNDKVAASLRFQGLGSLAIGEYGVDAISLKRGGFLKPYISIRKLDFDTDLAILRMYSALKFLGELEFADGRSLSFRKPEHADMRWSFVHSDGRVLCRFTCVFGRKGAAGTFYPTSDRSNDPEPLQLAIIGWYAAILIQREQNQLSRI